MMKARLFACTFSLLTASCLEAQELRVVIPNSGDLINDVDQSTVAMHAATPFLESSSLLLADINLEKIDVAAIYHSTEKHFPPRVFTDAQKNALLSWRVAILPYIEQLAMYRALKIDQPWNSEANQLASSTLILTYCADEHLGNKTRFRAPVFPGSLWDGAGPPKAIRDVHDGLSNTIAVMESPESSAIEWANPEPWILSHDDPMSDVFGDRENVIALMLDGSVRVLRQKEMTNQKLKTLLTISDAEPIED